jgi:DNA-directed RNA polymerase subunit K/omega
MSSDMLTKYEFAHIVGTRAQQIDKSGIHFADLSAESLGTITALDVAIQELLQKKCPLLIKRVIDKKSVEIMNPNHMILPKVPL